jgi:hypothetical protein
MTLSEMTLADHAEAWWGEKGNIVPKRETRAWDTMYQSWVEYAFCDQQQNNEGVANDVSSSRN